MKTVYVLMEHSFNRDESSTVLGVYENEEDAYEAERKTLDVDYVHWQDVVEVELN